MKYKRQLVLLETIQAEQLKCQHTIIPKKELLLCLECGAIWIKVEENGKQQTE